MTTLFKIDSKGKLRVLNIWTEGPVLKRAAGLYGGARVLSEKVSKPKNIGRSDATTAEEQAVLEAQSEVNKKVDEGYVVVDNPGSLSYFGIIQLIRKNSSPIPKPMLSKNYDTRYADYTGGVLASYKLDGMRCLAEVTDTDVKLWSRGSKPIDTMPHIVDELREMNARSGWTGILDGELYVHSDDGDNFQEIMKACKKYRKGISEQVIYHVYDLAVENSPAWARVADYGTLLTGMRSVVPLKQVHINSEEELRAYHVDAISKGYEGTMVKNKLSMYRQDARSSDLLKLKDFDDDEFPIVDVIPMEYYPDQGMVVVEKDGERIPATPKFGHAERARILRDKHEFIGKMGKISYFGFTDKGLLRFPRFLGIREEMDIS